MNEIWKQELKERRTPYFREVKVRLSPGEYEEIERIHGHGSVQNFIKQMVYDYLYHSDQVDCDIG